MSGDTFFKARGWVVAAVALLAAALLAAMSFQSSAVQRQADETSRLVEALHLENAQSGWTRDFQIKRYLLDRFSPRVSARALTPEYVAQDERFVFTWEISNFGDNRIGLSNFVGYDLIRCATLEVYHGSKWGPVGDHTYRADDPVGDKQYVDWEADNTRFSEVFPGDRSTFLGYVPFPQSEVERLKPGERVSLEVFLVIFDPDQSEFRDELEALDLAAGGDFYIQGKKLVFPRIIHKRRQVRTFEYTGDEFEPVELDRPCAELITEKRAP